MGIKTFALASLLVLSQLTFADELAVGLATPSPTGISVKLWNSDEIAYDMLGAWDAANEEVYLHFDYLIHDNNKYNLDGNPMPFYYGYGVRFKEERNADTILGLRIPLGISYFIQDAPFEVFGELAPRVDVAPSTNFGLDVMIGVRFRINELQKRNRANRGERSDRRETDTGQQEQYDSRDYRSQEYNSREPEQDAPPPVPNAPPGYRGY
ncbi:MAG: hypothetical protein OEZ68_06830 [Gammaproteobacteria bacterium]|nr:hypothetical protein [Gammaproteobacteria bacterium]MDH5800504.1 hypothetical protein [Gammaproteobacteria bacterium]